MTPYVVHTILPEQGTLWQTYLTAALRSWQLPSHRGRRRGDANTDVCRGSISAAIESILASPESWRLPVSGGVCAHSRAILLMA